MIDALRAYETMLEHRRPLIVFRAPFEVTSTYFSALAVQIAGEYERVRAGALEEGVELPAFVVGDDGTVPSGALKRAVLTMNQAARLLGQWYAGILVVLAPDDVVDAPAWRENVLVLAATRWSFRVRVTVFAPLGGTLCEVLWQRGALFDVEPEQRRESVEVAPAGSATLGAGESGRAPIGEPRAELDASSSGSAGESTTLGALLLDAASALGAGSPADAVAIYRRARLQCQTNGLAAQELTVLMALGAAYVAAEVPELSAETYRQAALLAEPLDAWVPASRAWLGVGAAYQRRQKHAAALVAFRAAAATAAKRPGGRPLRVEALRLAGICLLQLGREDDAILALTQAVDISTEMGAPERRASSLPEATEILADLLERRGLNEQAQHVRRILMTDKEAAR